MAGQAPVPCLCQRHDQKREENMTALFTWKYPLHIRNNKKFLWFKNVRFNTVLNWWSHHLLEGHPGILEPSWKILIFTWRPGMPQASIRNLQAAAYCHTGVKRALARDSGIHEFTDKQSTPQTWQLICSCYQSVQRPELRSLTTNILNKTTSCTESHPSPACLSTRSKCPKPLGPKFYIKLS